MAGKTTVFLAVTNDVYELPIAVADTLKELCRELGLSYDTVTPRLRKEAEPIIRYGRETIKVLKTKI